MTVREIVRNFRKKPTKAEKIFWQSVRNRKLDGNRFNRQHAIHFEYEDRPHFYVADFYCAKYKLIIEIDGRIHETQKGFDEYRTEVLNLLDYKVIRFKNESVINDIDAVLNQIRLLFI